ncbi:MAG: Transposase [Firmicutes bacterium]|nr:Transposase [Bacillota bacterium]
MASFIVDGKKLKSINQWYNKENARLQSIKDKQGFKSITNLQYANLVNRNNRVNYYMNKTARIIVNYCLEYRIGNIVVGYNPDWKRNINIGKSNNQKFTQIPHGNLRLKLQSLCERYGINYIEQEESYTSKSDFFANDALPVYNADNPKEYAFSGKRISRGQYRTSSGAIINADANGALNILRKSNLIDLMVLQARGCLDQPERIRVV